MLRNTDFSLATAGPLQDLAFIVFAVFTVGFFVWVAYLALKK